MEHVARQAKHAAEGVSGSAPSATEDSLTTSLERYTAGVPSTAYLGVALGAMAVSLLFQISNRGKWGNFVAQWVPTWLLFGLYNKLVKLQGHDRKDRSESQSGATRHAVGVSNRPLAEEWESQAAVPPRGQAGGVPGV
jgi:hypothetical protein